MKKLLQIIAMLLALVLVVAATPAVVADSDNIIPPLKEVYKDYFKIGCADATVVSTTSSEQVQQVCSLSIILIRSPVKTI